MHISILPKCHNLKGSKKLTSNKTVVQATSTYIPRDNAIYLPTNTSQNADC